MFGTANVVAYVFAILTVVLSSGWAFWIRRQSIKWVREHSRAMHPVCRQP